MILGNLDLRIGRLQARLLAPPQEARDRHIVFCAQDRSWLHMISQTYSRSRNRPTLEDTPQLFPIQRQGQQWVTLSPICNGQFHSNHESPASIFSHGITNTVGSFVKDLGNKSDSMRRSFSHAQRISKSAYSRTFLAFAWSFSAFFYVN